MLIVDTATGQLVSEDDFRRKFPDTSFSDVLTSELLEAFGHAPAVDGDYPEVIEGQYVVPGDAELVDGQWVTTYIVRDYTAEEIAAILLNRRTGMTVSAYQGRVALLNAGLLDDVEALVAAPETAREVKLAWEYATEWYRTSPLIISLAASLSLTEAQLDDLFAAGAQIHA